MLTVNAIKNVQSTVNRKISFKSGVQSNYGADVINNTADYRHEGNVLVDFLGTTVKQSPILSTLLQRQKSIEKGLEQNKLNALA